MAFKSLCFKQPFANEAGNTKKRALVYAKKFDGQEDETKVLFLINRLEEIKSPFCLLIDELHYHRNKCLAIMAASVDGSFNRFVFLRWFKSSDVPCDNMQIYDAYKSCLAKLVATGNQYCIGGVADGNFSNDGVRDLDSTCLWDYRHLEKNWERTLNK